jgi:hypothetical protein
VPAADGVRDQRQVAAGDADAGGIRGVGEVAVFFTSILASCRLESIVRRSTSGVRRTG